MSNLMGPPQPLESGPSYVSPTDGFVIGNVEAADAGGFNPTIAWIWGATDSGMIVSAAGGMMNNLNQTQSFMMPVAANEPFTVNTVWGQMADYNPEVAFYYVPLGDGTAVITGDSESIRASRQATAAKRRGPRAEQPVGAA